MKKVLLGSLSFACFLVANAQTGKVGIKTDTPRQTLDVNGTMRIKDIGDSRPGELIFWNEKTKQWIQDNQKTNKKGKIYSVSYAVHIGQEGQDEVYHIPLGINSKKYTAIITQSYLVKTMKDGQGKDPSFYYNYNGAKSSLPAYMKAILTYRETFGGVSAGDIEKIKFDNGYLHRERDNKNPAAAGNLSIPEKDVSLDDDGSHYYLSADYRDAAPYLEKDSSNPDGKYTWVVTLLVLDKNWVQDL